MRHEQRSPPVRSTHSHPHSTSQPPTRTFTPTCRLRDDDRTQPHVLAYLRAESDYANAVLSGIHDLESQIVDEITACTPTHESSAPYTVLHPSSGSSYSGGDQSSNSMMEYVYQRT